MKFDSRTGSKGARLRKMLTAAVAAGLLLYAVPGRAETEISCGYSECTVKGPLDAASVAKLKAEKDWSGKMLRLAEDATDADLKSVVLLKDELLHLRLAYCAKITDLTPLAKMTKLQTLKLDRTGVTDLSPLAKVKTLKVLDLSHVKFKSLDFLKALRELEEIKFFQPPHEITDIAPFAGHTKLKKADFYGFKFVDLSPLKDATGMTHLSLYMTEVADLTPLSGMKSMQDLNLYGIPATDIAPLGELTELKKLNLYFLDKVQDYSALAKLTKMEELDLTFTLFQDLELVTGMPGLKKLHVWKCPIQNWAPLAKLTSLDELNVAATSFSDASLLQGMTGLKTLVLEDCPQFKDVQALKALPALESLRLRGTPVDVANAELFKGFPKLNYVALNKADVPADQVAKLQAAAPAVRINAY